MRTARYGRLPLPPNGIPARLTNYRAFAEDVGRKVRLAALRGGIQGIYAHGLCAWGVRDAAEWGVPMIANPHGMEEFKVRDPLKTAGLRAVPGLAARRLPGGRPCGRHRPCDGWRGRVAAGS